MNHLFGMLSKINKINNFLDQGSDPSDFKSFSNEKDGTRSFWFGGRVVLIKSVKIKLQRFLIMSFIFFVMRIKNLIFLVYQSGKNNIS